MDWAKIQIRCLLAGRGFCLGSSMRLWWQARALCFAEAEGWGYVTRFWFWC